MQETMVVFGTFDDVRMDIYNYATPASSTTGENNTPYTYQQFLNNPQN